MPIPVTGSIAAGATSTKLPQIKAAIDILKAGGYSGIRMDVGTGNYGNSATGDTSTILQVMAYVFSTTAGGGPMDKISWVLNGNPKFNGTYIMTQNNGTYLHQPNLPTTQGVWDWLVNWWQQCVDDTREYCIDNSLDPTTCLEFEWANENNVGGVSGPYDVNSSGQNIGYVTYPAGTYPNGTIVPLALEMIDYIQGNVDFHSIPTLGWNFEGESGTAGTTECNSFTGAHAASIVSSCNCLGTNCYAAAPSTPYSSVTTKAAFNTKVQANLTRFAANATIGAKTFKLREFGLDSRRAPTCTWPNTVRQDLVTTVAAGDVTGITEGNFFCIFNTNGASSTNQYFAAYNVANSQPYNNITVEVS